MLFLWNTPYEPARDIFIMIREETKLFNYDEKIERIWHLGQRLSVGQHEMYLLISFAVWRKDYLGQFMVISPHIFFRTIPATLTVY